MEQCFGRVLFQRFWHPFCLEDPSTSLASDAGFDSSAFDGLGNQLGHITVEHAWDDVFWTEFAGGDTAGDGARGGLLHGLVDLARPHVQRATKNSGKSQHVVNLVRVIAAAGRHDKSDAAYV